MLDLINVTHAAVIDCHGVKDGKGDFFTTKLVWVARCALRTKAIDGESLMIELLLANCFMLIVSGRWT